MRDLLRRDGLLSIVGTVLIVGFFVLAVYLPGERACQSARREIALANQTIDGMPVRIQKAADQQKRVRDQGALVRDLDRLLTDENELHRVLQQVANLARSAGLHVEKIQPQNPIPRETFRAIPFQLTVNGNFRRITTFLHGLETETTLFAVDRFSVKSESEENGEHLHADITFSVYVKRESFAGSAGHNDRAGQIQADET